MVDNKRTTQEENEITNKEYSEEDKGKSEEVEENEVKNTSEVSKEEVKEERDESLDVGHLDFSKIQDTKLEDVYKSLVTYTYRLDRLDGGYSFTNNELLKFVLEKAGQEYQWKDLPSIPNDDIYGLVDVKLLSYDKVDSILKKYFGKNYKIDTKTDLNADNFWCIIDSYDENSNSFIVKQLIGGSEWGPSPLEQLRKVVDVYEQDNEIKIEEKAIYVTESYSDNCSIYKIYKDPSKKDLIAERKVTREDYRNIEDYYINTKFNNEEEFIQNFPVVITINDYLDKASTITSIFRQNDDGTYYFVSSVITP